MGRRQTESWKTISSLCQFYDLEAKDLYQKSKSLLEVFRRICWHILEDSYQAKNEILVYSGSTELDSALVYLETFAPEKAKESFEHRISSLFKDRQLLYLAEAALVEVTRFPELGETYYEILEKAYFTKERRSEQEMLDITGMERSTYYDKKREAVILFGVALWGMVLKSDKNPTKIQRLSY